MGDAMKADGAFKGQEVSVTPLIGKLRLHVQGYVDKEDFFISPLKHEDVILGAPWFDRMADNMKFPERKVIFSYRGNELTLDVNSAVVKMTTLRMVLGLVAKEDMELVQMDVKTAFLHGDLHEDIYIEQPIGFAEPSKEHLVCKLKKTLYGLKQAPRECYRKFDTFMKSQGYMRSETDHCLYIKRMADGSLLILVLYVDDMLIVGKDKHNVDALKSKLSENFAMKDLGNASHILGMQINQNRSKR
ncbi:hypothetical protein L7F22_042791 [Adiantum nelumboides]|nr:hypothetical protein [Adiantum nelumboides]